MHTLRRTIVAGMLAVAVAAPAASLAATGSVELPEWMNRMMGGEPLEMERVMQSPEMERVMQSPEMEQMMRSPEMERMMGAGLKTMMEPDAMDAMMRSAGMRAMMGGLAEEPREGPSR